MGGLGLAPGANIGKEAAIFEAVHGTAPDLVGKGVANPGALMLAACLLLEHLGDMSGAARVRTAIEDHDPRRAAPSPRDLGGHATTNEFAKAVIDGLH